MEGYPVHAPYKCISPARFHSGQLSTLEVCGLLAAGSAHLCSSLCVCGKPGYEATLYVTKAMN